jgi:hypothetical protein
VGFPGEQLLDIVLLAFGGIVAVDVTIEARGWAVWPSAT